MSTRSHTATLAAVSSFMTCCSDQVLAGGIVGPVLPVGEVEVASGGERPRAHP